MQDLCEMRVIRIIIRGSYKVMFLVTEQRLGSEIILL